MSTSYTVDFSSLDDRAFESLVYDLMAVSGFDNVQWRSGGSDGGRDIDAVSVLRDASGHSETARWFCDAKLFNRGVGFEAIQPTLARATATNPEYLLLAVVPHLTPQCKDLLAEWQTTNRPRFRLRTWEQKDIQERLLAHPDILKRYLPASWTQQLSLETYLREMVDVLRRVAQDVKSVWRGPERRPLTDLLTFTPSNPQSTIFSIDNTQKLSEAEWAFVYWLFKANRQLQEIITAALNLDSGQIVLSVDWSDHPSELLIVPAWRNQFISDDRRKVLQHILARLQDGEMAALRENGIAALAGSIPPHSEDNRALLYVISGTGPNPGGAAEQQT